MQIDHGGGQFRMAHQNLYFTDIVSGFQQMRCKAVPQGVKTYSLFDTGIFPSLFVDSPDSFVR
jgi:hypothetical protein